MPSFMVVRQALVFVLIATVVVVAGLWLGLHDPQVPPSGFSSQIQTPTQVPVELVCDDEDTGDDSSDEDEGDDSDEGDDDELA